MAYGIDGRACGPRWPGGSMARAACAAVACILVIAAVGRFASCAPQPQEAAPAQARLSLDTGNAAQMHRYGLPTKADVMQFHLRGTWGYYRVTELGDELRSYDALPGSADAWDELYGVDPANAAFSY